VVVAGHATIQEVAHKLAARAEQAEAVMEESGLRLVLPEPMALAAAEVERGWALAVVAARESPSFAT